MSNQDEGVCIESGNWIHRWHDSHGRLNESEGDNVWFFRRRIDAVAFARRKDIRLEETQ